jgi:hypothetical protein
MSQITGEKRTMLLDAGPDGRIKVEDANAIPPGAAVTLIAPFDPPLLIRDFADQWGKIYFYVEDDTVRYSKLFSEDYIAALLRVFPDSGIGPRVTKKKQDR